MNIVFSTTRQWNAGDEFILRGLRSVLRRSGLEFNTIIYNRNPVVNPDDGKASKGHLNNGLKENSLDPNGQIVAHYAISAGTPEWAGGCRAERFLDYVLRHRIRISFLGVGLENPIQPSGLLTRVLKHLTDVFICRDAKTFHSVAGVFPSVQLLACPSILSAQNYRPRHAVKRIGCILQGTRVKWHSISRDLQSHLYARYRRLSEHFEVEYVAHFLDDLDSAAPKEGRIFYSGVADDFYEIYDRFDLVIGTRLHGCGIAASLGIPSISVSHDGRGEAAVFFGATLVRGHAFDLLDIVRSHDWASCSERVVDLIKKTDAAYMAVLNHLFSKR